MANTPNDYRDPKVSATTEKPANRNWLWIALAVIAGLILLAFLLGLFGGDEEEAVVVEEPAVVVEEEEVEGTATD